jgi:hypothetical protein
MVSSFVLTTQMVSQRNLIQAGFEAFERIRTLSLLKSMQTGEVTFERPFLSYVSMSDMSFLTSGRKSKLN